MKLLLALGILVGVYFYFLTYVTNTVLGQVQQMQMTYAYVSQHADQIAAGSYR